MSRQLRVILGIILVLVGAVWTLQGLGVVGGSAMSGVTLWAIIGPLVILAGLALASCAPGAGPDRRTPQHVPWSRGVGRR